MDDLVVGSIRVKARVDNKEMQSDLKETENIIKYFDAKNVISPNIKFDFKSLTRGFERAFKKSQDTAKKMERLQFKKQKLDIDISEYKIKIAEAEKLADRYLTNMENIAKRLLTTWNMPLDDKNLKLAEGYLKSIGSQDPENLGYWEQADYKYYAKSFVENEKQAKKYLNVLKESDKTLVAMETQQASLATEMSATAGEAGGMAEGLSACAGWVGAIIAGVMALLKIINTVHSVIQKIKQFIASIITFIIKGITSIISKTTGLIKKIVRWSLAIFGIRSAYMAVRQVVAEITDENEVLKNQIDTIKNGLANLIEPIIVKIVSLVATLLSFIGALIKQLTGKDIFAKASKNLASGAGSAKEIKKQLAGFDEMNILSDTSSSGSGSGTADVGLGDVNTKLLDTLNKIKEIILNGDWGLLAIMFSEALISGINLVIEKIKKIPWTEIGTAISDVINNIDYSGIFVGLVSIFGEAVLGFQELLLNIDFSSFFASFSSGIVNALLKISDYIGQIKWNELGQKLSDAFLSVDWLGIFNGILNIFIESIKGIRTFFNNIDWGTLASTFSEVINSLIDTITKELQDTDWLVVGETIGLILGDIITNIDWGNLILNLIRILVGLMGALDETIFGIMVGINQAIIDALSDEQFRNNLLDSFINMVTGILGALLIFAVQGMITIAKAIIQAIKEFFGIHSPSTVMEDEVGKPLAQGLIDGIIALKDKFVEVFKNMLDAIKEKFEEFKSKIKDGIMYAVEWLKYKIALAKAYIIELIIRGREKLQEIKDWILNKIKEIIDGFKQKIENIKTTIHNVVDWIKDKFNQVKTFFYNIGVAIGDFFSGAIKGAINGVLSWVEDKVNTFIRMINNVISIINKIPGVSLSKISTISLPRLATGAIINQPGRGVPVGGAIAGEAGREGILPLTDKRAMEELGREIGKWININATIPVNIGNRQVVRILEEINADREFAMNS